MSRKGLLPRDLQRWRMRLVMTLVFGGFATLSVRAAYLQGWQNDFLNKQGEIRVQRVLEIPAHRGMITDRRGDPLAISTPVESIWLNPSEADASPKQIQALASRLGAEPDELRHLFADKAKTFVYLKRQLPPEVADAALALAVKGVHGTPEFRRYYPAGEVMGQVLGVTGVDDRGLEGLEYAYQSWLAGEPGAKRVVRDRLGNVIEVLDQVRAPKHGQDLTLSINLQLQYLAYRELAAAVNEFHARAAAVVVLDARTGEVLALVNVPTYNPNNRATMTRDSGRNRAVTDTYEPGSTMKPFVIAAALEAGVVTPETRIDTGPGWFMVGEKRISDVHAKGVIDIAETIKVSSNVAAAKIALDMKSEDFWAMLNRAGFGTPPGSGFPGEAGGRLRPYETWRPIEKATMAYGHGLSVSLLQLARAYCAFADDGVLPRITMLKHPDAAVGVRVMQAHTARTLREMMEAVTHEGGTAPQARVMGYRVAGKTGTAHKAQKGGYAANKYIASFVGLAPVSDPRLVVAVMIDEPAGREYYGGQVAAPVFSKVMAGALRFMAIAPDAPLEDIPAPSSVVGEAT
ncbi:penicillin-binding protein 2 [Parasulfuritortus cantonensis]|uniref:Peptidoglycan D,D-transpeptidase FtsI n=1 Tax=Parasulfuritortus cantonensis TaxID=2528202 RepID=A0A4R1BMR1_9PROT|nr:penicillin-binding protein 2 [Parasulfuritortus cantonensis]TCJ18719.1 penicillin-binding protein 2 [Parasulfuritortus cantonensis]